MKLEIAFFLVTIVPLISGYCFSSFGRLDKTATGRYIPVCEYNGLDLLDKSTFKTASCLQCTCSQGFLQCCGFGVAAFPVQPPPGCILVADGCKPLVVIEADPTLDCYSGQPIKSDALYPALSVLFPDLFGTPKNGTNTSGNSTDISSNSSPTPVPTLPDEKAPVIPTQETATMDPIGGLFVWNGFAK